MSLKNLATPIPSQTKPLAFVAKFICKNTSKNLPDLSQITILVPQPQLAYQLRRELFLETQKQGHPAILLPKIQCLSEFAKSHDENRDTTIVKQEQRLLMLMKVLREHSDLYGQGSPWLLAENLLQLFDELTLHRIQLPEHSDEFVHSLAKAYSIEPNHPALLREARIVHILWHAWHQQLHAEQLSDLPSHYLLQLAKSVSKTHETLRLFIVGFDHFSPAEHEYLEALSKQMPLHIIVSGESDQTGIQPQLGLSPDTNVKDAYTDFLNTCYNFNNDFIKHRIESFKKKYPNSPANKRIKLCKSNSLEQEVQSIAIYIHMALAKGCKYIGVVSEDRRLARRLRALLERSDIVLNDSAGWALSTTYAGAIVENWLECIEDDFPYQAMLDLLKSPAITPHDDKAQQNLIYRLEHDVIQHENIASGIDRYIQALEYRTLRLKNFNQTSKLNLQTLLLKLKQNSQSLYKLSNQNSNATEILDTLIDSMQALGIIDFLKEDPAGKLIVNLLNRMQMAARASDILLHWSEFRSWFGRLLEQHYFSPPTESHIVQLLNLQQSGLQHFDALIIAAANEHQLPGNLYGLPFFNDAVRSSLGLPDRKHQLEVQKFRFRKLLESSQSILITWQKQQDGEPVNASPWVEALAYFHKTAYDDDLEDHQLSTLNNAGSPLPTLLDTTVPVSLTTMPAPTIPSRLVPTRMTVSSHQRLINCPYQFYASDILKLKPIDEIREALQKSDYGNRVHRCLEAFHIGVNNLPGPFLEPIENKNYKQAIQLLKSISKKVFTKDIEDNFQHRGWLKRWLSFIPKYIDWQTEHNQQWQPIAAEEKKATELTVNLRLEGRIDRIDCNKNEKTSLIDYKTGFVPTLDEVMQGEEVQLISYSMLLEHVSEVLYVGLDGNRINARTRINGEQLEELREAVKNRLCNVVQHINSATPTPAFGDESICIRCNSAGICRRKYWEQ